MRTDSLWDRIFASVLLASAMTFFPTSSLGASLQQVLPQEGRAAIALDKDENIVVGDTLLASYGAQNCPLKVQSVFPGYVIADISRCSFKENLKIGDKVEKSLIPIAMDLAPAAMPADEKAKPVAEEKKSSGEAYFRIGATVYYSTADTIKFDDVTVSSGTASGSGNVEYDSEGALGLGISIALLEENSWGFIGSLQYEGARSVNSAKATISGSTGYGSYTNGPKVSFVFFEANAVYRWERFYLPFGFNVSYPDITNNISGADFTYKGGLGADLGVGFFVNENSAVELWSRSLAIHISGTDGSYDIDYGTGNLTGIGVGWKFWF